jgi:uncharacterized membrane protein
VIVVVVGARFACDLSFSSLLGENVMMVILFVAAVLEVMLSKPIDSIFKEE